MTLTSGSAIFPLTQRARRFDAALLWPLIRQSGRLRRWVKATTGFRLKGLGFLLRRLRSDFQFFSCGFHWYLDHRIAGPYASLLACEFNEPETHIFLRSIADSANFDFAFADVGANIGEMVIPMAAHARVKHVIAFEPHPICAEVCRRNLELNGLPRGEVREVVVGDGSMQPYVIDEHSSPLSGIQPDAVHTEPTQTRRLDEQLTTSDPLILLIDVEGAELQVMEGARNLISAARPLIIFEYHAQTAKRFSLDAVRALLGADYEILRLRSDGRVDDTLRETWNCVAVHRGAPFYRLVQACRSESR
jgi:FkbM family methyltransferase